MIRNQKHAKTEGCGAGHKCELWRMMFACCCCGFYFCFFEQGLTYPGRSWTQHMTMCILRKALCLYSHTPIPGRFWVVAFSRSLRDEWAPSGWGRETQVPGAWGGAMTGMSNWRTSTGKSQALTRSQQVNMELASPAFLLPCHPVMSRKKIAFLGTMATKYWKRGQRKVKECSIVTHQESTKHRLFLNWAIRQ